MARSECFCEHHSCEPLLDPTDEGFIRSPCRRFQFDKEDNVIVDGGPVNQSIENCEIRIRGEGGPSQKKSKDKSKKIQYP